MPESAVKVDVEDLSAVRRKLSIEVPAAEVAQEVDRAYRKLGKQAKVKGFRPGKVPRAVLELYYHKQVEQEVSEDLMRRSLADALKEKSLEPVSLNWPDTLPPVVAGEDFRFSVEMEVPPEFTVENYQGLTLEAPPEEDLDALLETRLKEIRENNAILQPLPETRAIENGDYVALDYQGYFAGKALAEAKQENMLLEVGAGRFSADFEKNLLGLAPEEETRFTVDLPQDYFNPLLAGKTVDFEVKIHGIKEKKVPEADDTFAQSLGGDFQTMADLREAVREDIIKGKERERQGRLENQALDQLLAAHAFEAPPSMIRQEQEGMLREQWQRLAQHGMNLEGLDPEKMLESLKPAAERRVRSNLILERLAAQEKITVDEAEVEEGLQRVAASTGREVEQVRQLYQERELFGILRRQLRDEKTIKFVLEHAKIVPAKETGVPEAPETEAQEKV
ncbi:MAG: trigger factor [Syntrophales bacterium]|nr:trigger factor [Syntrophales bacterium]MDD5642698.1 trigger factor [Syntrophales bacterium]